MTNYRVFDGHCDTPVELWLQEKQLRSSDLAVSLDKAAGLGGYAQFFAFCTAWIKTRMPHTEHFSRALDYFLEQLRKNRQSKLHIGISWVWRTTGVISASAQDVREL